MATIIVTFKTKLQEVKQNTSLTNYEKREQIRNLMKQHRPDLEDLLTNDQKEKLKNSRNNTAVK